MKTLFVVVLALIFALPLSAQIHFGVRGGLDFSKANFNDVKNASYTGWFIGPSAEFSIPLTGLSVDGSALFTHAGSKVSGESMSKTSLEVPVNLKYGFGLGSYASLFLFAGPQWGFKIDSDNAIFGTDSDLYKYKDSFLSANIGIGVKLLAHLQIMANYNIKLDDDTEFVSEVMSSAKDFKSKNTFQLGITYFF